MKIKSSAFTLIELLIVVAIIGILAAIAVPNFLNAQIRAKISRAQSDMRTIGQALEMYRIDQNTYPPWQHAREAPDGSYQRPNEIRYYRMTTPVAYLSSIPADPFINFYNTTDYERWGYAYDYVETVTPGGGHAHAWGHVWRINSWGPDLTNHCAGGCNGFNTSDACPNGDPKFQYNASNGLNSRGDIVWVGGKGGHHSDWYCNIQNGY